MTTETTDTPEPRYENFRVVYPSGTVIESFCPGGATLEEVRIGHLQAAEVTAVEDSRVTT